MATKKHGKDVHYLKKEKLLFKTSKDGLIFALSSIFVGCFLTTTTSHIPLSAIAKASTRSAIANSSVTRAKKLGQPILANLASSETKETRSQQLANMQLEVIEPQMIPTDEGNEFPDPTSKNYNEIVRTLQRLPSKGQSREIRSEDNDLERLLKQQLNDSLEIYQIIGQLLEAGKLNYSDSDVLPLINSSHLPSYQGVLIAIAEANLATYNNQSPDALFLCMTIADDWKKNSQLLERAGLGTSLDVMIADYFRSHCTIQSIQHGFTEGEIVSNYIREYQFQQEKPSYLKHLVERERSITKVQQERDIQDPLFDYDRTNTVSLQSLSSVRKSLEIRTEDSNLQKLQKQQLDNAIVIYRLQGLRLMAGLLDDHPVADAIMLPAILIAISDMNLATKPNEWTVAEKVCLEIVQTWEKDVLAQKQTGLEKRIQVLTVDYWRRHCEIQKLLEETE